MSLEPSLRTIFNEALEREDLAERSRYLDTACGADHLLRDRLEKLLQAHTAAGNFLSQPSRTSGPQDFSAVEKAGQTIGRYKLLEQIGEGGCGVVYMAEQQEPVRRRVALKIIKLGMDTRSVIARFEAERQALALMDHPNIAKVLDAGATQTGRPYFVMELVRGVKITDYCDQHNLPTEHRLHLFIQVCKALQHAHQKGIIHRDLKPANILVTLHDGVPVPKVIDFGIAKATGQQRLTDKTIFTAFEQFIGTPAYMSPEQAEMSGLDIDTRSDIYSLGVLLYELLTGKPPFDNHQLLTAGLDEMRRIIREVEPRRPSLATRHSPLATDLDSIVLKCLEKDRTRRYQTALELADDIQRHLNHEPVTARPPTRLYQFQKLIRRHKLPFAAATAITASLIVGTVVSTMLYFRERAALGIAAENAQRAEQKAEESLRNLYAADMILAQGALQTGNIGRARELLRTYLPSEAKDLRGWEWRYGWEQCRSEEMFSLTGHTHIVNSLALSPDGGLLASGSHDNTVKLWDLKNRIQFKTLAENSPVRGISFSKDGRELIVGSRDDGVSFWSCETWTRTSTLSNLTSRTLTISPDGKTLAVMGAAFLTLWDLASHNQTAKFKITDHVPLAGVAFSPDSTLLAYSKGDGSIMLWNLAKETLVAELKGHRWRVQSLIFSPDGSTLVSGGHDRTLRIWQLSSSQEPKTIATFSGWVGALAFNRDGTVLAVAGADQRIRLFETQAWEEIKTLKGHLDEVWALVFPPGGRTLVSAGRDRSIKCWPISKNSTTDSLSLPHIRTVSWPTGAKLLYLLHTNRMYSVGRFNPLREVARYPFPFLGFTASTISPDGNFWVAATNGVVRVFDHENKKFLDASTAPGPSVSRLAFSRDGSILAAATADNTCHLWSFPALKKRAVFPAVSPGATFLEFSRSDRLLGIGHGGGADIWNVISGQRLILIRTPANVGNLSISPDEKTIATVGSDEKVHLWQISTGNRIASLGGQLSIYNSVAFSPDGKRLAASGADGKVTLWDTNTFQEVASLKIEEHGIYGLDFVEDPDDSLAVVGVERVYLLRAPAPQAP